MTEIVWSTPSLTVTVQYERYFKDTVPEDVAVDLLGRLLEQLAQAGTPPIAAGANSDKKEFYLVFEDVTHAYGVRDALQRVYDLLNREQRREKLFRDMTGRKPKKG